MSKKSRWASAVEKVRKLKPGSKLVISVGKDKADVPRLQKTIYANFGNLNLRTRRVQGTRLLIERAA